MDHSEKIVCLLLLVALCVGCRTHHIAVPVVPEPQFHPDTTVLPTFPVEVLYVLGCEWEAVYDSTSSKFHTPEAQQLRADSVSMGEYIEQRLLTLYPERAYSGYVSKVERICQDMLLHAAPPSTIINNMHAELQFHDYDTTWESFTGAAMADTASTSEERLLEFTPQEHAAWDALQHIADQPQWADRTLFDTLQISSLEEENLLLSLLLWRGPRIFYRVIQSKVRAENLAKYYYGEETHSGKPGDAFKHIYVNVLLRSYTDAAIAWLVMDVYWENWHPNAPCDHFMDVHNNTVGRETQYRRFVRPDTSSEQCTDVRQWLQWAEQVQHFVQDTTNGTFHHWDKQTPSFIVIPEAEKADAYLYLYWDK